MNAPIAEGALANPTITMLRLDAIVASPTHIQELRRARFDQKLIGELAESIKQVGILQAILVRPLPARGTMHELVAGERRWLAAKKAGLAQIPATVRELSDEMVLEVQLIENLQREGLHELEEAEGYEELMKLKKISADVVAEMVGRSRSYVFKRTKLLALCPEARKAFYAGEMDASTALLIARIPGAELQKKAMADLSEQRNYGDIQNFKDAQRFIHEHYMLDLRAAPFKLDDIKLVPAAGPCTTCPKRTGNQKDLFGDVKSGDTCTDPKCFGEKKKAGEAAVIAEHKANGVEVIVGDAAKRVLPYNDSSASGGYHLAGEKCWSDPKERKFADLVEEKDVKLVISPHSGKMLKVVHSSALPSAKKSRKKAATKAKSGPDGDLVTERLVRAIHEKFNGELTKTFMQQLVVEVLAMAENAYVEDELLDRLMKELWGLDGLPGAVYGGKETLPKALQSFDAKKLARFSIELIALFNLADGDGRRAESICEALKIDRKKLEKEVAAEAKAAAAAVKTDGKKKPAKK